MAICTASNDPANVQFIKPNILRIKIHLTIETKKNKQKMGFRNRKLSHKKT